MGIWFFFKDKNNYLSFFFWGGLGWAWEGGGIARGGMEGKVQAAQGRVSTPHPFLSEERQVIVNIGIIQISC